MVDTSAPQNVSEFENRTSWDVAVRFQDLKRFAHIPEKEKQVLKKRAIEGIIERATQVMGNVIKPEQNKILDYQSFLAKGARGELDVLETFDEALSRGKTDRFEREDLRFDSKVEKESQVALVMDCSLSMTGEKIALLAVSTAVVALSIPSERLALMAFDSKVKWIKKFKELLSVEKIIERVLELPAGGFTNMELALKEMSKTLQNSNKEHANVIFIGDGKYTEGQDPSGLAFKFRHLNILKLGKDQSGRDLLLELSKNGSGKFFEARKISELPKTMYGAIRSLLR